MKNNKFLSRRNFFFAIQLLVLIIILKYIIGKLTKLLRFLSYFFIVLLNHFSLLLLIYTKFFYLFISNRVIKLVSFVSVDLYKVEFSTELQESNEANLGDQKYSEKVCSNSFNI